MSNKPRKSKQKFDPEEAEEVDRLMQEIMRRYVEYINADTRQPWELDADYWKTTDVDT